jgi:ribonuclease Z
MKFNSKKSKIILLGTGNPDPKRFGPSLAIVVSDSSYLIDFGAGITRRTYSAFNQLGIKPLESSRLTKGFLTHVK